MIGDILQSFRLLDLIVDHDIIAVILLLLCDLRVFKSHILQSLLLPFFFLPILFRFLLT